MRETEQFSIPMRDTTPHPTSTKAPKPSRWVTVAGRTVPGGQRSSSARASSWARRRERVSWGGAPSATPVTVKEMGFPTRERMAISRAVPLPDAQGGLLPGNGSGEGAQVHQQIVARGAQDDPALQHGFLLHSLAEGGEGLPGGLVFWGVEQAPFWEIQVGHTLPSFLIP